MDHIKQVIFNVKWKKRQVRYLDCPFLFLVDVLEWFQDLLLQLLGSTIRIIQNTRSSNVNSIFLASQSSRNQSNMCRNQSNMSFAKASKGKFFIPQRDLHHANLSTPYECEAQDHCPTQSAAHVGHPQGTLAQHAAQARTRKCMGRICFCRRPCLTTAVYK